MQEPNPLENNSEFEQVLSDLELLGLKGTAKIIVTCLSTLTRYITLEKGLEICTAVQPQIDYWDFKQIFNQFCSVGVIKYRLLYNSEISVHELMYRLVLTEKQLNNFHTLNIIDLHGNYYPIIIKEQVESSEVVIA